MSSDTYAPPVSDDSYSLWSVTSNCNGGFYKLEVRVSGRHSATIGTRGALDKALRIADVRVWHNVTEFDDVALGEALPYGQCMHYSTPPAGLIIGTMHIELILHVWSQYTIDDERSLLAAMRHATRNIEGSFAEVIDYYNPLSSDIDKQTKLRRCIEAYRLQADNGTQSRLPKQYGIVRSWLHKYIDALRAILRG